MKYLKKQPFVMSGLTLGLAALGNLLQSYSVTLRLICGAIALVLFLTLTVRILMDLPGYFKEAQKPVAASVFPTYPMSLMLLATYLEPLLGISKGIAVVFWWIGIIINLAMMIKFTMDFVPQRKISLVFPSWGVVYCGIAVASVTAPYFAQLWVGQAVFWIGLIGGVLVMPFMLYRVYKLRDIPEPALPSITILCAPFSLLVAGYAQSFPEAHNLTLLAVLLVFAQILYITTVVQVPNFMRMKFIPSFAGLTFPLVISALSLKMAVPILGWQSGIMSFVITVETVIATLAVVYVLVGFLNLIFKSEVHNTPKPENVSN